MAEDSVVITISLGVLALIGGLIAAEIGRRGTRYAADLSAQQASREVQVSMLTDFIETVLDTSKGGAVLCVWGSQGATQATGPHRGLGRGPAALRTGAGKHPPRPRIVEISHLPDISAAYETCDDFFFKLIRGTDEDAEWELWGETLYDQSDPITW